MWEGGNVAFGHRGDSHFVPGVLNLIDEAIGRQALKSHGWGNIYYDERGMVWLPLRVN